MPLNPEEKYAQKKFESEREHYQRLTPDQLETMRLKQQLEHAQNTISYLDDYTEKQTKKLDLLNGLIRDSQTMSDKEFKSEIMRIVGWSN